MKPTPSVCHSGTLATRSPERGRGGPASRAGRIVLLGHKATPRAPARNFLRWWSAPGIARPGRPSQSRRSNRATRTQSYTQGAGTELPALVECTWYRMDAKPSGRLLTGHSSGGWAALWLRQGRSCDKGEMLVAVEDYTRREVVLGE